MPLFKESDFKWHLVTYFLCIVTGPYQVQLDGYRSISPNPGPSSQLDGYRSTSPNPGPSSQFYHGQFTGYQLPVTTTRRPDNVNINQSALNPPGSFNISQPPQRPRNQPSPNQTGSLGITKPSETVELISLSPPENKDVTWPNSSTSHGNFCMDLEGIDFSASQKDTSEIKSSSSMEDVTTAGNKSIYPDIRSAFRFVA